MALLISSPAGASVFDEVYGIWGGGGSARDTNYKGLDPAISPIPLIMGGVGDLTIEANRASYPLYRDGTWFGSAVGLLRGHQALGDEDAARLGVEARRATFELGAQIGRRLPFGFISRIAATHDVSFAHEATEIDLQLFRAFAIGPLRLVGAVGGQYQTSGLTDYYYGAEGYTPGGAFVLEAEVIATLRLGRLGLILGTRNFFYDSAVTDSPLVDRAAVLQGFMGAGYAF